MVKLLLSSSQEAALLAVADTFMPPILSNKNTDSVALQRYYQHNLRTDEYFVAAAKLTVEEKLCPNDRFLLFLLLSVLSTWIGTSLLFGSVTVQPFAQLDLDERIRLLQGLQNSQLRERRKVFQGLKRVLLGLALSYKDNPFWEAAGFPGSPRDWQTELDAKLVRDATERLAPIQDALIIMDESSNNNNYSNMRFDIVIVGAGAGGCVAANVLSKSGYSVLVVDKGCYLAPDEIEINEAESSDKQYDQHGLISTRDGNMLLLAGSGVGGGTAINWSCCLPLPEYVRDEWVGLGLKIFGSSEYQQSLASVMERLGASDTSRVIHNSANQRLLRGCKVLGYHCETTGQNLRDASDQTAGFIGMGDRYANKNGGVQAFLLEAVQHGAKIMSNCTVNRVLTDDSGSQRRAVGIECTVGTHTFQIMADKSVVVAAGALRTPCILQKSFRNKHIGRHLHLHPASGVYGITAPDEPAIPILGAPMTTVCNQFAKGDNEDGYGCKVECPIASPGLLSAATPWRSPRHFKETMLKYRNLCLLLILQRDSGEGSVKLARDGQSLVVDYSVSKKDRRNILNGMKGAAKILLASGVAEVGTCHIYDIGFKGNNVDKCLEQIEHRGTKDLELGFFSAHQMGSCRMSDTSEKGVVDECGEVWECDDLYIMDASVFPTASGSNPMVTTHTIADMLASRLVTTLLLRDEMDGHFKPRRLKGDERAQAARRMIERQERRSKKRRLWENPFFRLLLPVSAVGVVAGVLLRPAVLDSLHSFVAGSKSS